MDKAWVQPDTEGCPVRLDQLDMAHCWRMTEEVAVAHLRRCQDKVEVAHKHKHLEVVHEKCLRLAEILDCLDCNTVEPDIDNQHLSEHMVVER